MRRRRAFAGFTGGVALLLVLAAPTRAGEDFYLRFPQLDEATEFTNSWGQPRDGGRLHRGTDLMGEKGMPVVAALDGIVVEMGSGRRSGYYVRLEHEDGLATWYMHLNNDTAGTDDGAGGPELAFAEDLEVGDLVEAGQLIGFVGDSGNAERGGAHVHFELRIRGTRVNPYRYLRDAWERWQLELAIERGETDFR